MDKETQPAFFGRRQSPLSKLIWFGGLAIALSITDSYWNYLKGVRQNVSVALYPLQKMATLPGQWWESVSTLATAHTALQQENQMLRMRELQVTDQLQREQALQQENQELRRLMGLSSQPYRQGQVAEMLYAGRDPFTRKIIIGKGLDKDVAQGVPVLDGEGLVGQVTLVHKLVSEVTLVTDKNFLVPVEVQRTRQRTLLYGLGVAGSMEVRFMAVNGDVQQGDLLVTSGLDEIYPPGIAVARVSRVERNSTLPFAKVLATPVAGVEQSRFLLVLAPKPSLPAYPQPPEPEKTEGKKGKGKGGKS